jgi:hypothetical protein
MRTSCCINQSLITKYIVKQKELKNRVKELLIMFDLSCLHCYGCAHSAASEAYPGKPSGERPCCFCIRNPDQDASKVKTWYDGSKPIRIPMDAYHSVDMKAQIRSWTRSNHILDLLEKEAENYPENDI